MCNLYYKKYFSRFKSTIYCTVYHPHTTHIVHHVLYSRTYI